MRDLQTALSQRFPLLTSLRLFRSQCEGEDIASFMGVLLATMEASRESSLCFVFPRQCGIAPLSAALYALGRFAVDFPKLAERYARTCFQLGQRVKLVPGEKVFIFDGVWQGQGANFRLKLPDDKMNTTFNWPMAEILRIEPTTHKIPKGRQEDISTARKTAPLTTLDRLIGTQTFGNLSLAVNYVLYLGGRAEVDTFLAETSLGTALGDVQSPLSQLLVPGVISESGEIRHQDNFQAAGQPLLAISSRIDHIAAACSLAPPRSNVVVVDGAKRITDLAKFDAIAESQNLIIVAEADEEEKLQQLHDRGCKLWRFSLADLEMGEPRQHSGQVFSGVFRSARNEADFLIESLPCRNSHLEEVVHALEACQAGLDESEGDETHLLLRQIYGVLLHCTGLLAPPDANSRDNLLERARKLAAAAADRLMWLPEASARALEGSCEAIARAIEDPELGRAKGSALRELMGELRQQGVTPVALVARSIANRLSVSRWIEDEGLPCPVLLPGCVGEHGFFERLICTSWPGSGNFRRIALKFAAPHLVLVAYPFERQWLNWFRQKGDRSKRVPSLTSLEKSALLGLSGEAAWPADPQPAAATAASEIAIGYAQIDLEERMTRKGMLPIAATGEETTLARLVGFSGDAYAFLTPTFRMPVITDLVSGIAGENYKVPRLPLAEIRAGDVLVFRDSGSKEVIQTLADAQIGPEASEIRARAARWHEALRRSGHDEVTLLRELEQVKCPRTLQTVRGWLADDSMIGPQTRADLEAIAYAVGDQQLLDDVPSIWAGIHFLRGEHLKAGVRLSRILLEQLPHRLEEMREGRTRIEIDNATSAWIVQVESIADTEELRPRSLVNALLWDTEEFT